jgi:hypothetical protein
MGGYGEIGSTVVERRWRWQTGDINGGERSWDKMQLRSQRYRLHFNTQENNSQYKFENT